MIEIRQPHPSVGTRKRNASKGGQQTAKRHSAETLAEWGRKGGRKTQERYSNEFFTHIRTLRKKY